MPRYDLKTNSENGIDLRWSKYAVLYKKQNLVVFSKGKGKVHLITGHEGPEVEYRYRNKLSLTSALEGNGWLTPHSGRFTLEKDPVPVV
jgi:hypothetical protein